MNSDANISKGVWLYCYSLNLTDDQASRILTSFLSSEVNRNFTRRIDLNNNQLTKIPKEVYQFKRLKKIFLDGNKIKSIGSRELYLNNFLSLNLNNNQINHIEEDAFEGD